MLCFPPIQAPPPLATTAQPLSWTVEISEASSGKNMATHMVKDTSTRLVDLSKGTVYQLRVAGINVRGVGSFTDYQQRETLVDCKFVCTVYVARRGGRERGRERRLIAWGLPLSFILYVFPVPGSPQNVAVAGLASVALTVTWQHPADNGGRPILRYIIMVNGTTQQAEGTDTSLVLSGGEFLTANTTYE